MVKKSFLKMGNERREHLIRFYSLLDRLEKNIGGARSRYAPAAWTGQKEASISFVNLASAAPRLVPA
jgi:hypothetical protein